MITPVSGESMPVRKTGYRPEMLWSSHLRVGRRLCIALVQLAAP